MGQKPHPRPDRRAKRVGSGLCWHCGGPFNKGPSKQRSVDGNPVRVHVRCDARLDAEEKERRQVPTPSWRAWSPPEEAE